MKHMIPILILSLALACSPQKQESSRDKQTSTKSKVKKPEPPFKFEFEEDLERIQVVAYSHSREMADRIIEIEKDGKLDFKAFKSVVALDSAKTFALTNILSSDKVEDMAIASCYIPRHAIHFMGKDEQLLGYIEICFECNQTRTSSPTLGVHNQKKFDKLKAFIRSCVGP